MLMEWKKKFLYRKKKLKLSKCSKVDSEKRFSVRYSDIDLNLHVGNVTYLEWILETIPFDIMTNYKIDSVKIKYQKRAYIWGNSKC